jgi:hypothetical protein
VGKSEKGKSRAKSGAKSRESGEIAELERKLESARAETAAALRLVETVLARDTPKDMIEAILAGLAPLFLGYRDPSVIDKTVKNAIVGSTQIDDIERGVWFPDIEFDEAMEPPEKWPTKTTISGNPTEPSTPSGTEYRVANGQVTRKDGQSMFQAGATSPPPVSGNE